jgi:hypothetical protein
VDERTVKTERGQQLLVLTVALLVAILVALFVIVAIIQHNIVEVFWSIDPSTGFVVERIVQSSNLALAVEYEHRVEILLSIFVATALCVGLVLLTLRFMDRERRLGLPLMALPLAVPLVLGLGTALLTRRWSQDALERIHELLSDAELENYPLSCFGDLEPCSRLLAFDTVFSAAAMAIISMRFDAPERQLVEFESFAELALATVASGSDGLGIGL